MEIKTSAAQYLVEHVNIEEAAQIEGATWEAFQLDFFNQSESKFWACIKARQIAMSFSFAALALAEAALIDESTHIFISINTEEAKQKRRYVEQCLQTIPARRRPKIKRENLTQIELSNGSRMISNPCKAPRGYPRAFIYLDEIDHWKSSLPQQIYTGSLPATAKGGKLRIASSVGTSGSFLHRMFSTDASQFKGYTKRILPWWTCNAFCTDLIKSHDANLTTEQRVNKFGRESIKTIFQNMFLEDFEQEFCCLWADGKDRFISWPTIDKNIEPELLYFRGTNPTEAIEAIHQLLEAIEEGKITGDLTAGLDIGRKKDLTELTIVEEAGDGRFPIRLMISLDRQKFPIIEEVMTYLLTNLPISQFYGDCTGLGMQLMENLAENFGQVHQITFTPKIKEKIATNVRIMLEKKLIPLPPDRDLQQQIHSIRKTSSSGITQRYDAEANEAHHADRFWSLGLAISGAKESTELQGATIQAKQTTTADIEATTKLMEIY